MKFYSVVLESFDWSVVEVAGGTGTDLKNAINAFLEAASSEEASELWRGLEGSAFAQDTIYGAAEPTVEVMVAALADEPPGFLRAWILEVLRFILSGASEDDPELAARCREAAERGEWLLAAMARRIEGEEERRAILEVLDHIDLPFSSMVRRGLGGLS